MVNITFIDRASQRVVVAFLAWSTCNTEESCDVLPCKKMATLIVWITGRCASRLGLDPELSLPHVKI